MEKEISGKIAIERMRRLKYVPDTYFSMIHFTCNLNRPGKFTLIKVEKCRLRPALKNDTFQTDGDHYLCYQDIEKQEPRMCFKKLIRYVAFPPDYEFQKVNWFI